MAGPRLNSSVPSLYFHELFSLSRLWGYLSEAVGLSNESDPVKKAARKAWKEKRMADPVYRAKVKEKRKAEYAKGKAKQLAKQGEL